MQAKKSIQQGAILLLTAGLCHVSEAQAPSLESTLQWIKMRLPAAEANFRVENGAVDIQVNYSDVVVNGCSLSFTITTEYAGPRSTKWERIFSATAPLGQLSSVRYIPHWDSHAFGAVSLQSTHSGAITNKWKTTSTDGKTETGTGKAPGVELPVSDADLAQRLKSAFSRAIELCGGKKEAF
jgi:hypothetical protein